MNTTNTVQLTLELFYETAISLGVIRISDLSQLGHAQAGDDEAIVGEIMGYAWARRMNGPKSAQAHAELCRINDALVAFRRASGQTPNPAVAAKHNEMAKAFAREHD